MPKEYVKLISVSSSNSRIVPISSKLIKKIYPNASKDTELYGRWMLNEETNELILQIKLASEINQA